MVKLICSIMIFLIIIFKYYFTFRVFTACVRLHSSGATGSLYRARSAVPHEDGPVFQRLRPRSSPVRSWSESRGDVPTLAMKLPPIRSPWSSVWRRTAAATGRWTDWNSGCLRWSRAPKASVVSRGRSCSVVGGREARVRSSRPKKRRNEHSSTTKRPGPHSTSRRPSERRPGPHSLSRRPRERRPGL